MADLVISLPAVITITNETDRRLGFVPYRENFTSYIKAGASIQLEATTSGQVLYYLAQGATGLTITQEAKDSTSGD